MVRVTAHIMKHVRRGVGVGPARVDGHPALPSRLRWGSYPARPHQIRDAVKVDNSRLNGPLSPLEYHVVGRRLRLSVISAGTFIGDRCRVSMHVLWLGLGPD